MSREIKFRAWNGSTMNYSIIAGKFGAFWVNSGPNNDGLDDKDKASLTPFNTKCSESTHIMQFIGLRDRNEKQIYEGDVVVPHGTKSRIDGRRAEVIFKTGAFQMQFYDDGFKEHPLAFVTLAFELWKRNIDFDNSFIEVIGNIHENPELIKGKEGK